jgi:hypothetical protein
MSVYVDSAATGAADGTSYTDAFTTIQAAINSLPVVLEHAVTIYVRKGASAYSDTLTINQIIGKGSLTIRGEYYWTGTCAAAGSPSTTIFQVADTTGMAAGDAICIIHGNGDGAAVGGTGAYYYYKYTTIASVNSGTQLTITAACDWGNIGTSDYYVITKTAISGTTTITSSHGITLAGLTQSATITVSPQASVTMVGMCLSGATTGIVLHNLSQLTITKSYVYGSSYAISTSMGGVCLAGTYNTPATACVLASAGSAIGVGFVSSLRVFDCILYAAGNAGIVVSDLAAVNLYYSTIAGPTGAVTPTGIIATGNSAVTTFTINNKATTPLSPASSTDNPVILSL